MTISAKIKKSDLGRPTEGNSDTDLDGASAAFGTRHLGGLRGGDCTIQRLLCYRNQIKVRQQIIVGRDTMNALAEINTIRDTQGLCGSHRGSSALRLAGAPGHWGPISGTLST